MHMCALQSTSESTPHLSRLANVTARAVRRPYASAESQSCLNTVPIPAAPDMIPSVERVPAARLSHLDLSSSNDGAGTSQGVPHEDHLDLAY
jgi:hypothetical protein